MTKNEKFQKEIEEGYSFEGESVIMGAPVLEEEVHTGTFVRIPLSSLNRHGLIAGATGTGKTKTLQIIAENLSAHGVPSLLMDIKGDLSGIAKAAKGHPKIDERHKEIGLEFAPGDSPVELLSLTGERGIQARATVSEFGPVLLSRILNLNSTQQSVVAIVYKYADDNKVPLMDLEDFKLLLLHLQEDPNEKFQSKYGRIASSTMGAIIRKVVELEQQGAERFFGEPSFEIMDLLRQYRDDKGMVTVMRVNDMQERPKLFSTFMLQLMSEIYRTLPEAGDLEKPKLCVFIDEAHLLFKRAEQVLLNQIETMVKLIRSKGVGLFFVTQNPDDIPEAVLGQLGLKVQHALRAFTAKDRKNIKLASQNYPVSNYYDISETITRLGIGEAFITALDEDGIPTPLSHTLLRAPQSRMDVLSDSEIKEILKNSMLKAKYEAKLDRDSAKEIIRGKMEDAEKVAEQRRPTKNEEEIKWLEVLLNSKVVGEMGKTLSREVSRGLLGGLWKKR